LKLQYGPVPFV